MSQLKLKIVTPSRIFYDGEIDMLIARGLEGDFAILKNHLPLMAVLAIRYLKIKINGEFKYAAIAGGYLTFKDNQITIMSDACEWREEIDKGRATAAMERAQKRLKDKEEGISHRRAELALKKAINRLGVKENM